jgi:hypothetical protein
MPIQDVRTEQLTMANLIADPDIPLLTETIEIDDALPLGSLIAMNPATRIGSLVTAANQAQLFGVLRDHVYVPGQLAVVFISGSFIQDTLKSDTSISVVALVPRLRELGIFARPSVHYPSFEKPVPIVPQIMSLVPNTAAAGSGALGVRVTGRYFIAASVVSYDGTDLATTFVSETELTATITPVAPAGNKVVRVKNGAVLSNPVFFVVT